MYWQTFTTLQWYLKRFHLRFHVFIQLKYLTLNVPFGALMVFTGCSIPSIGRAQCSASIHSQTALIHQLQWAISWEVHMSEDDETCLYCHCDITRGQGVKWGVEFRC